MQCVNREKLLSYILEIGDFVDLYEKRDPRFVAEVILWMGAAEKTLKGLRLPLAGVISAERAKILAVVDGYRDPLVNGERMTTRKITLATASIGLSTVQDEMRSTFREIDGKLDLWREKMAQFLAVATQRAPITLPPTEPREAWLAKTWADLNIDGETQGMYRYLNAAMQPTDRLYILNEVIENLLGPQ